MLLEMHPENVRLESCALATVHRAYSAAWAPCIWDRFVTTAQLYTKAFVDKFTKLVLTAFAEAFAVATTAPDCEVLIGVYTETYSYDPETCYPETCYPIYNA